MSDTELLSEELPLDSDSLLHRESGRPADKEPFWTKTVGISGALFSLSLLAFVELKCAVVVMLAACVAFTAAIKYSTVSYVTALSILSTTVAFGDSLNTGDRNVSIVKSEAVPPIILVVIFLFIGLSVALLDRNHRELRNNIYRLLATAMCAIQLSYAILKNSSFEFVSEHILLVPSFVSWTFLMYLGLELKNPMILNVAWIANFIQVIVIFLFTLYYRSLFQSSLDTGLFETEQNVFRALHEIGLRKDPTQADIKPYKQNLKLFVGSNSLLTFCVCGMLTTASVIAFRHNVPQMSK
jgi:hypothetical protein